MNRVIAAGLVALTAVALVGCSSGGGDGGAGEGEPDLVLRGFAFVPSELTVPSGEAALQVVNEDDAQHNITIEEIGVDEDLSGGAGVRLDFTADTPGDFAFFCKFHPEQMVGQLTVE